MDRWESSGSSSSDVAIRLCKATKHYGSTPVLINLDMEVRRGQIYGLLGPSGCGKTTLLKCIVGKFQLESGRVQVFGGTPGNRLTGVPGPRVGYMPQELALFPEFTIEETLRYFARIFGLSEKKYEERLAFLLSFLDLPSKTRMLQRMSGGQQRRASLAVALLHEPDLLILDEPTVGVDPLLRTSIWQHLAEIASHGEKQCTIVVTTHYIEEARQAHRVGMMRFGKLLAEDAPANLLTRFNRANLEDVFLELCLQDGDMETTRVREERAEREPIVKFSKTEMCEDESKESQTNGLVGAKTHDNANGDCGLVTVETSKEALETDELIEEGGKSNGKMKTFIKGSEINVDAQSKASVESARSLRESVSIYAQHWRANLQWRRVGACMAKTFTRLSKRWGFIAYHFLLPALQVSLFCLAIGQDPKSLPVAVVNDEIVGADSCPALNASERSCPVTFNSFGIPSENEDLRNFACRFLGFVDSEVIEPVFYEKKEQAVAAVSNGDAWGVVSLGANFTHALYRRVFESMTSGTDLRNVDNKLLDESSVKVRMDVTNQHIAFTLQVKFVEAFDAFIKQMISACNASEDLASIPLVFEEPVYGSHDLTFTDFMAPGIILTIVYSLALGYSAMAIIIERNEGLLDRTWVAGVSSGEFALAHFFASLIINLIQVVITLGFMILIFQVPMEGSLLLVFTLTMLQGVCGTTIGLIISAVCETQQDATQIALGIFYPNLILSGIIWPIESMPTALKYVAWMLPQTFACEAMRGILLRGWGLMHMPVWRGFAVTIAWIVSTFVVFRRLVNRQT